MMLQGGGGSFLGNGRSAGWESQPRHLSHAADKHLLG